MPIRSVSVRDQCHKPNFYGADNRNEDMLGFFENHMARVISSINESKGIPRDGDASRNLLLLFVALQSMRTAKAADQVEQIMAKISDRVYSGDRRSRQDFDRSDVGRMLGGSENAPESLLNLVPDLLESILDLNAHLVISRNNEFLASDNPAFKYNQYCEGLSAMGTTGAIKKGFQVFLPISPSTHLVLYDGSTYRVKSRDKASCVSTAQQSDIETLNMLQMVSAGMNVYFSNWSQAAGIDKLYRSVKSIRDANSVVVSEFGRDGVENESLIHTYEQMPNLSLELGFLHLRRRALRIPLRDRHRLIRMAHGGKFTRRRGPHSQPNEVVRYSRFLGRS